jgi:hypothetical protein
VSANRLPRLRLVRAEQGLNDTEILDEHTRPTFPRWRVAVGCHHPGCSRGACGSCICIFLLIEAYRAAAKTVAAAASDLERREEMLIEQGLGSSPFIPVLGALWTTIWQARS